MREHSHGTCPRCEQEMTSRWEPTPSGQEYGKMVGGIGAAWNASIKALVCLRCWGIMQRSN